MSYKDMPFVVTTEPENYATGVATDKVLKITFSTDMRQDALAGHVLLHDIDGRLIPSSISYANRVLSVKPSTPLAPGLAHILTIVGDANLDDSLARGVLSILDYPMAGNHVVNFTTATSLTLIGPVSLAPANGVIIQGTPFELSWSAVQGAASYEVVIGTAPNIEPSLWTGNSLETRLIPAGTFLERAYFWRVRAIGLDGQPGNWSETTGFVIDSTIYSPVTGEDDLGFDDFTVVTRIQEPVLMDPDNTYPANLAISQIKILLPYQPNANALSWRITGFDMGGNPTNDHGAVYCGTIEVVPQPNGTSIVVLPLNPLDGGTDTLKPSHIYEVRLISAFGDHRFSFVTTCPFLYSSYSLLLDDTQHEISMQEGYRYLYLAGLYCHDILDRAGTTIPSQPDLPMRQYVRYRAAVDCLSVRIRKNLIRGRERHSKELGDLRVEHSVGTSAHSPGDVLATLRRELLNWERRLSDAYGITFATRGGRKYPYPPAEGRGF